MFKDVDLSRWSYKAIKAVVEAGLMGGFPDGTFRPADPLTREQLASVLHRWMFRDGIFSDILPFVMPSVVCLHTDRNLGSGACVAYKEGVSYIITNRHVVEGFKDVTVIKENMSYSGKVKTMSSVPGEDLALVETVTYFPELSLAEKPAVLGECVAVVGAPAGLMDSVTVGVVSHTDRDGNFQLDSPINPGNSGGPIINERGEIVGVAVSKVVGEAYEGLGFAIKLEIVKKFLGRVGI